MQRTFPSLQLNGERKWGKGVHWSAKNFKVGGLALRGRGAYNKGAGQGAPRVSAVPAPARRLNMNPALTPMDVLAFRLLLAGAGALLVLSLYFFLKYLFFERPRK